MVPGKMIFDFLNKARQNIGSRLLIHILLFSGVVTLMITVSQIYIDYKNNINEIDDQFARIGRTFKNPLAQALWFFNEKSLRVQLEGILNVRDVEYVELTSLENQSLAAGEKKSRYTIEHTIPLVYKGEGAAIELGILTVVASKTNVYNRLFGRLVTILISQAIKTFLVSTFIFLLFHFLVVKHIAAITIHLKELELGAKPQTLKLRRKYSAPGDELDQTAASINEMSVKLHDAYETVGQELQIRKEAEKNLQKAYADVEKTIEIRTDELGEVNEQLKAEVEIRKKAEEDLGDSLQISGDLLKYLPSGINVYDYVKPGNLILVNANTAAEKATGHALSDIEGKEFNEIWPEARNAGITDRLLEIVRSGESYESDDLSYHDNRLEARFRVSAFMISPTRLVCAFEDITVQKQAEMKLEDHRQHLENHSELLEKKVIDRTADLQKTINLMAGREIRMSELKKDNQKLQAQIEKLKTR
jgi:PAS domain-containing protein